MTHIITRRDLVDFAREHVQSRSCKRAFVTGQVTVLGGFSSIPPSTDPGWMLRVTSVHQRSWLVVVTVHEHDFRVWIAEKIPWRNWDGVEGRDPPSIYEGDRPQQAAMARWRATT